MTCLEESKNISRQALGGKIQKYETNAVAENEIIDAFDRKLYVSIIQLSFSNHKT